MGWKNWSYWLRGGVIGLIVMFIQLILSILLYSLFLNVIKGPPFPLFLTNPLTQAILFIISFPFSIPALAANANYLGLGQFILLAPPIVYFIIGAIIGLIVGKVKKRKADQLNLKSK